MKLVFLEFINQYCSTTIFKKPTIFPIQFGISFYNTHLTKTYNYGNKEIGKRGYNNRLGKRKTPALCKLYKWFLRSDSIKIQTMSSARICYQTSHS